MLSLVRADRTLFVGLKDEVLYRIELGFAVVDDGERLVRIRQSVFEKIVSNAADEAPALLGDQEREVVDAYPSVFELFDDAAAAARSLDGKEL